MAGKLVNHFNYYASIRKKLPVILLNEHEAVTLSIMPLSPENLEHAIAAGLRAVSGRPRLTVHFTDGKQSHKETVNARVTLRQLPASPSLTHLSVLRGSADSIALYIRYHDAVLHSKYQPSTSPARTIFDKAEEARCQSLGIAAMPGIAENITATLTRDALLKAYHLITGTETIPMADIVGYLVREAITGIAPPSTALPMMERWGKPVRAEIAAHLAKLPALASKQDAFAKTMLALIKDLPRMPETPPANEGGSEDPVATEGTEPQHDSGDETTIESLLSAGVMEESSAPQTGDGLMKAGEGDTESTEEDHDAGMPPEPETHPSLHPLRNTPVYHAYTTLFDEIVRAEDLCNAEELTRLRMLLDTKLSQLKKVTNRLAHRLQRKLLAKHLRSWEYNLEEGTIDSGKLAQLIADPNYAHYYMLAKQEEVFHTTVTLLLDNSGSMRGRPITVAAMTADILSQTLERCGVRVEILGFTSADWKGGQSKKKWLEDGKPANPGRLNDLRHIIYKAADTPWRRAKKNLGLMLRDGLLKENIDGEALLWAHDRLLCRPEQRRILMVISDGAPVDDSTLSANSPSYLENHLKEVIHTIEHHSSVELIAIGIGHDVTRYYQHAVTIRDIDQLGDTMFIKLAELL